MSDQNPTPLRDVRWLAQLLDLSISRAGGLAREGVVPSIRIGRRIRFDEAVVREWLRRGGSPLERGAA